MDNNEYGRIIVEQIINDYKQSKEFKNDAVEYVRREVETELNFKAADAGLRFGNSMESPIEKASFIAAMMKIKAQKEALSELLKLIKDGKQN